MGCINIDYWFWEEVDIYIGGIGVVWGIFYVNGIRIRFCDCDFWSLCFVLLFVDCIVGFGIKLSFSVWVKL